MTTFFSAASRGFYSEALRADYDRAGTWPLDAVEVDADTETALRAALVLGSTVEHINGEWRVTPPPPIPFEVLAAPRMESFRQNREIVLNRLSGIGFSALQDGDQAQAHKVAVAREILLATPSSPAVQIAQDLGALNAALNAEWAGAADLDPEIATAMAVGAGGGQTRPPPT